MPVHRRVWVECERERKRAEHKLNEREEILRGKGGHLAPIATTQHLPGDSETPDNGLDGGLDSGQFASVE